MRFHEISWDFMRYVFFFWLKFDFYTMSKGFLFLFFPTTIQVYFRFRKPRRRWRKCPVFQPFAIFLEVAIEPSRTDLKTFLLHNHHLKKNGSLDNKNADWINEHRDMNASWGIKWGWISVRFYQCAGISSPQSSLRVHVANNGMCWTIGDVSHLPNNRPSQTPNGQCIAAERHFLFTHNDASSKASMVTVGSFVTFS